MTSAPYIHWTSQDIDTLRGMKIQVPGVEPIPQYDAGTYHDDDDGKSGTGLVRGLMIGLCFFGIVAVVCMAKC